MSNTENEHEADKQWTPPTFYCSRPPEPYTPLSHLINLYHLLLQEYFAIQGLDAKYIDWWPQFSSNARSNLRAVLPEHNGWWWNPQFDFFLRTYSRNRSVKDDQEWLFHKHLNESEWYFEILRRSRTYALRNYADDFFQNAIRQADQDVYNAYLHRERRACYDEQDYLSWEDMYEDNYPDEHPHNKRDVHREIRYYELRRHWIDLAYDYMKPHIKEAVSQKDENNSHDNFARLIKPKDLKQAWNQIDEIAKQHAIKDHDEYKILGDWYVRTLYKLGARWQNLRVIRTSNKRRRVAHSRKPGERRYITYAELMRKRINELLDAENKQDNARQVY